MNNYYELLGVRHDASAAEIKKAFREKAKRLHPDIAGGGVEAEGRMRKLLTAYETLSSEQRRYEYDRAYSRFIKVSAFDYRTWLRERDDPASQAKLVFFELLHLEEDEAIALWRKNGGMDFPMEKHLGRENWMDCAFILAEELDRRGDYHEAFRLLVYIVREERRLPYFRHFTEEIEKFVREIVRLRLRPKVDDETWVECMETLLALGFPARDERFWMSSLAQTLLALGDQAGAEQIKREAARRGRAAKTASGKPPDEKPTETTETTEVIEETVTR
ncbi:MAG: J domain-containing protein [Treponema sp.]|nr:J domain-containing protein [Treponema sp.]